MPMYFIILLLIGIPALYGIRQMIVHQRRRRKQLSLAMAYEKLVLDNKLSIEDIDISDNKVIALDRKNNKLVLINHSGADHQEQCIPLLQIASCNIIEERDEQEKNMEKLVLQLMNKRNNMYYSFCFYDAGLDATTRLPSLSRQALLWKNRINAQLPAMQKNTPDVSV